MRMAKMPEMTMDPKGRPFFLVLDEKEVIFGRPLFLGVLLLLFILNSSISFSEDSGMIQSKLSSTDSWAAAVSKKTSDLTCSNLF